MGITFENCLVFQSCVQKVAEVSLTIAAIGTATGLVIAANPVTGVVTATVGGVTFPIVFELCCQPTSAFFRPTLLTGKIINCGWVNGVLLIRNTDTGVVVACVNLALTFQEVQEAAGVLPTDFITELVVKDEGTALCLVLGTNPFTAATEPFLDLKCVFLVQKTVTRDQAIFPAICTPVSPCPTQSPACTCPPLGSNQVSIA